MAPEDNGVAAALRGVARVFRRMSLIAGMAVIVMSVAIYGGARYFTLIAEIDTQLAVEGQVAEAFIAERPDSWELAGDRLEARLERFVPKGMQYHVRGAQGLDVTANSVENAMFFVHRERPLYAFGEVVGHISLGASYADRLLGGAAVLLLAIGVAVLFWGPLQARPLDALANAETHLLDRDREIREAYYAAEAANRAKSAFVASMSHELRTPLNAVLGYAQLLATDVEVSADTRELADEIVRAGGHLVSLIDDVLDLARIESGNLDVQMADVDLSLLIAESLRLVEDAARRKNIELVAHPSTGTGLVVHADSARLRQVLLNFLTNAIKYNRVGGRAEVAVDTLNAGWVRIAVTDSGLGIAPDKQRRLFTAFDRLGAENGSVEGTGIGLVIAKRIAEAMNGRIGFTSVEGRGSMFWVELPRPVS